TALAAPFRFKTSRNHSELHSFPTRRSSDLNRTMTKALAHKTIVTDSSRCSVASADYLLVFRKAGAENPVPVAHPNGLVEYAGARSEEHTSELQSLAYLVCRLLLEKKKRLRL